MSKGEKEMIKIIKEGLKKFHAVCPFCYCEFTYEKEDLHDDMIHCPCCDAIMGLKSHTKEIPSIRDNMAWETPEYRKLQNSLEMQVKQPPYVDCNKPTNPCETCPYFLKWKTGQIYVGDSPCQWCQYSGLRVTCTSTGSSVNGVK